jgi:hypothetical protein
MRNQRCRSRRGSRGVYVRTDYEWVVHLFQKIFLVENVFDLVRIVHMEFAQNFHTIMLSRNFVSTQADLKISMMTSYYV